MQVVKAICDEAAQAFADYVQGELDHLEEQRRPRIAPSIEKVQQLSDRLFKAAESAL